MFRAWNGSRPEVLWRSGDYLYCRTSHGAADGGPLDRIAVVPSAEHPIPSSVSRLAHEFALKDHLDSSWAVRPLDLVHERGRTMLVLEHVTARPLEQILGAPLDLDRFLKIAIAASNALARLHASGLVHKDIRPGNILVDGATG